MTIGEKIRKLRNYTGLTQKELGELSGTSETTIKQYELGKRQPRIEQLKKIAKVFDIALYILLDDTYPLPDISSNAWKNRARFYGDTEMGNPPSPFTAPINTEYNNLNTDESQARFEWINERLSCGKEITEDDEKFRWEYMKQTLKKIYVETTERIQNAYNQLNQEGKLRAAEQVEMLAEIPKYRKDSDTKPDASQD